MIKYFLVQKRDRLAKDTKIAVGEVAYTESGKMDFEELRCSSCSEYLFDIPAEKQKELNETGRASYTIVTTTVVNLEKV